MQIVNFHEEAVVCCREVDIYLQRVGEVSHPKWPKHIIFMQKDLGEYVL